MSSLDEWVLHAADAVGVPATDLPADLRSALLSLAEELSATVGPSAGPMAGLILGLATGRGLAPLAALETLRTECGPDEVTVDEPDAPPGADTTVPTAHDAKLRAAGETGPDGG